MAILSKLTRNSSRGTHNSSRDTHSNSKEDIPNNNNSHILNSNNNKATSNSSTLSNSHHKDKATTVEQKANNYSGRYRLSNKLPLLSNTSKRRIFPITLPQRPRCRLGMALLLRTSSGDVGCDQRWLARLWKLPP